MKISRLWYAFLMLAVMLPATVTADDSPKALSPRQLELIETNLLYNLNTCCSDLFVSCAQLVIDLKNAYPAQDFSYAILPLMNKMKNDPCCEVRLMAALTLSQFDSDMARYAISRRVEWDDSPRVRRLCAAIVQSWKNKPAETVPALNASL